MKPLGAGKLISPEHTPFHKPLTVAQCIHYALSRPAVVSVLSGCKTPEEIREAVKYLELDDAERDYTDILSQVLKSNSIQGSLRGSCLYCSHCQPCPSQIDIATVNKYLDIAVVPDSLSGTINIPPSIRSHYQSLQHKGNECTKCANCESRCPFGVPIIINMEKAEMLLG
jgi:hypothetical protein